MSKRMWIAFSGVIWIVVGVFLLTLGVRFIVAEAQSGQGSSLITSLSVLTGGREQAALALVAIGLLIGFVKGRYVLIKTVKRVSERILSLPLPIRPSQVYSRGYLLLIGGMIALGISLKWLGIPLSIRGLVDVAVGSALIHGAMAYFRVALVTEKG